MYETLGTFSKLLCEMLAKLLRKHKDKAIRLERLSGC